MSTPTRFAVVAALLVTGWFSSDAVRGLAYSFENKGVRVSFEMLGIEIGLCFLAFALALALPGRVSLRLGLGPGRLPWSAGVALVIGTVGLSAAIDGVLSLGHAADTSKVVGISRELAKTPWAMAGFALLASAAAPGFSEEILCRGLVQRSVAWRLGPWVAVPVAAVFFGWLHQEWVHGSVAAVIGLYLGVAAYWADSTRPAIAAHFANNAAALLSSMGLLRLGGTPWTAIGVGLALAGCGLAWVGWTRHQFPEPLEPPGGPLMPGAESADP